MPSTPTRPQTNPLQDDRGFILKSNLETAAMIGILVLPLFGFALGALGGATSKIRKAPAMLSTVPS